MTGYMGTGILRKCGSAEVPTGILRKSSAEDFRRLPLGCHLMARRHASYATVDEPGVNRPLIPLNYAASAEQVLNTIREKCLM